MSRTYFAIVQEDGLGTPRSAPTGEESKKLKATIQSALVFDFAEREWDDVEKRVKYLSVHLTEELVALLSQEGCLFVRETDTDAGRFRTISEKETDRNGYVYIKDVKRLFRETRLWCMSPESKKRKHTACQRGEWQFYPVDSGFERVGGSFDFDWTDELLELVVLKPEGRRTRVWQLIGDRRIQETEVADDDSAAAASIEKWVKTEPTPLFQEGNSPYESISLC